MTAIVGIFRQEDQVMEGIRQLREAGAESADIRVVVGNRESAPLLGSSSDVNLEELREIQATRRREHGDEWVAGVAPLSAYPAANMAAGNTGPGVIVAADDDGSNDTGAVLAAIGIPDRFCERCADAIDNGHYLLVVDDGREIGAQRILNRAGASEPD
ncbi:hypothetical protein [Cohnella cellulosilytica]|uniref:Heat induced stress protein YflT n=1 Tax=Cohnella cellulosilytica TaxID=986710 RepID=A0ABW2F6V7_9BACL